MALMTFILGIYSSADAADFRPAALGSDLQKYPLAI